MCFKTIFSISLKKGAHEIIIISNNKKKSKVQYLLYSFLQKLASGVCNCQEKFTYFQAKRTSLRKGHVKHKTRSNRKVHLTQNTFVFLLFHSLIHPADRKSLSITSNVELELLTTSFQG